MVSHASRGYLQDKAEIGGCSVLLLVVFGGVDVDLLKADEAGEVRGALQNQPEETAFSKLRAKPSQNWVLFPLLLSSMHAS